MSNDKVFIIKGEALKQDKNILEIENSVWYAYVSNKKGNKINVKERQKIRIIGVIDEK